MSSKTILMNNIYTKEAKIPNNKRNENNKNNKNNQNNQNNKNNQNVVSFVIVEEKISIIKLDKYPRVLKK